MTLDNAYENREFCRTILVDINNARLNPSQFLVTLDKLYKKNKDDPKLKEICIESQKFMSKFSEKLMTLHWSPELERSAMDHYIDMA